MYHPFCMRIVSFIRSALACEGAELSCEGRSDLSHMKYCVAGLGCFARSFQSNVNLLQPTGYVMHHQFNIQQLYALPTLYLCVLHLSENKQRLVPLTA